MASSPANVACRHQAARSTETLGGEDLSTKRLPSETSFISCHNDQLRNRDPRKRLSRQHLSACMNGAGGPVSICQLGRTDAFCTSDCPCQQQYEATYSTDMLILVDSTLLDRVYPVFGSAYHRYLGALSKVVYIRPTDLRHPKDRRLEIVVADGWKGVFGRSCTPLVCGSG